MNGLAYFVPSAVTKKKTMHNWQQVNNEPQFVTPPPLQTFVRPGSNLIKYFFPNIDALAK